MLLRIIAPYLPKTFSEPKVRQNHTSTFCTRETAKLAGVGKVETVVNKAGRQFCQLVSVAFNHPLTLDFTCSWNWQGNLIPKQKESSTDKAGGLHTNSVQNRQSLSNESNAKTAVYPSSWVPKLSRYDRRNWSNTTLTVPKNRLLDYVLCIELRIILRFCLQWIYSSKFESCKISIAPTCLLHLRF